MQMNLLGGLALTPPPLPAWEGGHPGRHAGWKPALLQEERDALHSSVICSHDTICATRPERGYALFPL